MIRTLLDTRHPFIDGITLEQLDAEHSVRLKIGDPFLPFANGGFGTPSGKCEFHAETLDYEPPVESRLGDAGAARALSARNDLAQERRQHELDFRLPRRSRLPDRRCSSCIPPTPARAPSRPAMPCACSTIAANACCAPRFRKRSPRASLPLPPCAGRSSRRTATRSNMLTSQRLTDKGGGPTFYSCLVQVEKIGD